MSRIIVADDFRDLYDNLRDLRAITVDHLGRIDNMLDDIEDRAGDRRSDDRRQRRGGTADADLALELAYTCLDNIDEIEQMPASPRRGARRLYVPVTLPGARKIVGPGRNGCFTSSRGIDSYRYQWPFGYVMRAPSGIKARNWVEDSFEVIPDLALQKYKQFLHFLRERFDLSI